MDGGRQGRERVAEETQQDEEEGRGSRTTIFQNPYFLSSINDHIYLLIL